MTDAGYFDDLYGRTADPWGLATEPYEARKYALTLASLPRERYRRVFEPGCAIGVLTRLLARRCDEVLAWDGAAAALALARARLADLEHVTLEQARVPMRWPGGGFDLLVVSELLYFLDAGERTAFHDRALGSLEPGGHLIAVHWRHGFDEASSDGDAAHAELAALDGLSPLVDHVEPDFLLGLWERARD
ncbi:MAG: methyltransferase domain-containing protein [Nocardioidaceae bacterium]|nr:methyltransferase domain-containing protein [Nocardioidaceae bacterium]